MAYQKIGVPSAVLMLNPWISYLSSICLSKSLRDDALNYQSYQTENSVFPIFDLGAGPGSVIWTKGTAKLTKAFLQT